MKHRKTLFACILAFCTIIPLLLHGYKQDEKNFTKLSERLFREEMLASTLNMHYTLAYPENFGITDYQAVLPCYSAVAYLQSQAATENLLTSLNKIDEEKLSENDAYSYKLLNRSLENSLQLSSFAYYEEPLSPSSGMQSQLPILLAEYTFRDKQDVEDYLCLLDQTDEYFASLLRFEQEKAAARLLMPASSLEKVKKQCDTIITPEELEKGTHFLQTTFTERLQNLSVSGTLTEEEVEKYLALNNRLLSTVMQPAYESLADGLFLLEDSSIALAGLAAKPLGKEYYQSLLCNETGSYRNVTEIKMMLTEKLEQEYDAIRSLAAANPRIVSYLSGEISPGTFPLTTAEEMLRDLQTRIRADFPPLPKAEDLPVYATEGHPTLFVKNISPSLEKYCAPAFYLTAPLDDTNTNVIYINQKNSPSGVELYTTLAHEGYPGHLYQTVYSNRVFLNNEENNVRNLLWYGGYLEGWALYVEFLSFDYAAQVMEEQNEPMTAILIEMEKHNRSLQLCLYSLLDIMIHYENASYSQVAELLTQFGITEAASVNAIYSYIAEEPCNYPKYYVGYLEILALREEAQKLWGDSYSDYAFHKFYLDRGPSDFTSLLECLGSETLRKN